MYKFIEKIIYFVVYYLFNLCEYLKSEYDAIKRRYEYRHLTPEILENGTLNRLKKLPNHITVILDEDPSFYDLAQLVNWCLRAKIPFVSFYDQEGTLKKLEDKLEEEILKRKRKSDHIFWHNGKNLDFKNGFSGNKIHFKIFTSEDSKQSTVDLCKKLVCLENSPEVTVDKLSWHFGELYEFPDPDVGIVFSKTFKLFNYPMWQIRLTEFYRLNTHHSVGFDDFFHVLLKYSKCDQRFGR